MSNPIKIGVSSCLCGNAVRHDGSSKKNSYLLDTLANYFKLKPYCPELGAGLSVPRPTMRLKRREDQVILVETKDQSIEHTDALRRWSEVAVEDMDMLSGFVLKNASPSCGMERVKLYDANDVPKKEAVGIFAAILLERHPCLPVEEEGRLNDSVLRENFIQRVYVYNRWISLLQQGLTVGNLMDFHRRHKFILLAHDEQTYRELGPLVAGTDASNLEGRSKEYIRRLMSSLRHRASRKRHTNVLMHIFGFLKEKLESEVKHEVLDVLDRYRIGMVPLIVPLTLIRHYLKQYPHEYMDSQYYLEPYPDELMLRNDV